MKTQQPSLFGTDAYGNPIARAADPQPSHDAATAVTESGQRFRHAAIVFGVVERHPHGLTYIEIWRACSASEQADLGEAVEVMRRLNDLVKGGAVVKGNVRECTVKRTKMTTWKAA